VLVGYARVSTDDQDLTLQRTALKQAGCKRIYEEKVSGATRDRPALTRMLDQLREGDVVVVARLDRLARSTRDLLEIAEILKEGGTGLRSLGEPWADTTSPAGKMVLTVFAGMAEFERALIHQRTSSGRVAARMRGVRFGRPPKLTPEQIALGRRLVDEGTSVREVAKVILKCHPATLYRELGRPSEHPGERSGRRVSATPRLALRADPLLQVGHDAVRDRGIGVRGNRARRRGRAWLPVGLLRHVQFSLVPGGVRASP
jgi:DNA invertase Pin-like site-specific DNA recombinase